MSLQQLMDAAFFHGPAAAANALFDEVRRQHEAVGYEVVPMGRPFAHLQQEVAPRLALFLRELRRPVFVGLFVDETLYFLDPHAFFDVIRQSLGLDPEAFAVVRRRWEQTGRASGGVLSG